MSWRVSSLDSLCTKVYSGGTPSTNVDAYYGGEIPWLRTQEVTFNRIKDTEAKITDAGLKNSAAKWVPANSVIVAMYGNSAGRSAITEIPLTTNQACCNLVVDEEKADFRFVFYSLLLGYERLKGLSRGAAQNNLNAAQVKAFEINTPSVHVQRAIGDLVSSYDDLIENNRRRMALLEESARLLYREWFVRLRFPGYEHTPIVDGVPQGWLSVPLGAICTKIGSGFTPRGGEASYRSEGVTLIRSMNVYDDRFDDGGLAFLSDEQAATLAGVTVESKDILINITGASVARCCMAPERYLPARVNQHVMIIRVDPEKADPFFVHKAINSDGQKRQLLSYARKGSTREALTKDEMARFEVTLPTTTLLRQFGEIAATAFRQREVLALQNQKLRTARDLLLPRLMSGELAV